MRHAVTSSTIGVIYALTVGALVIDSAARASRLVKRLHCNARASCWVACSMPQPKRPCSSQSPAAARADSSGLFHLPHASKHKLGSLLTAPARHQHEQPDAGRSVRALEVCPGLTCALWKGPSPAPRGTAPPSSPPRWQPPLCPGAPSPLWLSHQLQQPHHLLHCPLQGGQSCARQ